MGWGREGEGTSFPSTSPLLLPSALFAFIFLQVVDDDTIATFNLSNIPGSLSPLLPPTTSIGRAVEVSVRGAGGAGNVE